MNGAIRKLVGIASGFVRIDRGVGCGIAVGCAPVGKSIGWARGESRTCGVWAERRRVLTRRAGRRGTGGRA